MKLSLLQALIFATVAIATPSHPNRNDYDQNVLNRFGVPHGQGSGQHSVQPLPPQVRPPSPAPRPESPRQGPPRTKEEQVAREKLLRQRGNRRANHRKSVGFWRAAIEPNQEALLHARLAFQRLPNSYWSMKVDDQTQALAIASERLRLHKEGSLEMGDHVWTQESPLWAGRNADSSIRYAQETINAAKDIHGLSDEAVAEQRIH